MFSPEKILWLHVRRFTQKSMGYQMPCTRDDFSWRDLDIFSDARLIVFTLPLVESLARTILWFRIGGRFFCEKCSNFLSRVLIQSKVVRMRERKAFAVQKNGRRVSRSQWFWSVAAPNPASS
jgi:hypothetical protein